MSLKQQQFWLKKKCCYDCLNFDRLQSCTEQCRDLEEKRESLWLWDSWAESLIFYQTNNIYPNIILRIRILDAENIWGLSILFAFLFLALQLTYVLYDFFFLVYNSYTMFTRLFASLLFLKQVTHWELIVNNVLQHSNACILQPMRNM